MQAYLTFSDLIQQLIRRAVADAVIHVNDMASDLNGFDRIDAMSLETVERQAVFALWQQLDPNGDSSEDQLITKLMREAIREIIGIRVQFCYK